MYVHCIVFAVLLRYIYIPVRYGKRFAIMFSGIWAQQAFREFPTDTEVRQGDSVQLKCEIDNIGGLLQWTKDGFALGK